MIGPDQNVSNAWEGAIVQSCLRNQGERGNEVGCQTGRPVIYILGHLASITRGTKRENNRDLIFQKVKQIQ